MNQKKPDGAARPEYLKRWPGLSVRDGDRIVRAPAEDEVLAKSYPEWPDLGPLTDGTRITLLAKKNLYGVNEEVRVIHVVEVTVPGHTVYVMGPKTILGEYVDDKLVTPPPPSRGDPLVPEMYDGATLRSPAVDYNYDVTRYRFATPGMHHIEWRMGKLKSNVLSLEVK